MPLLVALTCVSTLGVGLLGLVYLGPLLLLLVVPYSTGVIVFVRTGPRRRDFSVGRELGAAVLAALGGAGIWVVYLMLGMVTGVVGFLDPETHHPHEGAWFAIGWPVGIAALAATWTVLHRAGRE